MCMVQTCFSPERLKTDTRCNFWGMVSWYFWSGVAVFGASLCGWCWLPHFLSAYVAVSAFFFFFKLIRRHVIGVLCNSLFLGPGLLMHFSTEYSAFAFVPVHYLVISFPLSFPGAGSQGQRYQHCSVAQQVLCWPGGSGCRCGSLARAPACCPFSQPASRPPAWWRRTPQLGCYRGFAKGPAGLPRASRSEPQWEVARRNKCSSR